jgi:hypothetical protein
MDFFVFCFCLFSSFMRFYVLLFLGWELSILFHNLLWSKAAFEDKIQISIIYYPFRSSCHFENKVFLKPRL